MRRSFSFQFHPELLADLREFNKSGSHDYNLFKKDDYIILTGGSGMYIDAVCRGLDNLPKDLASKKIVKPGSRNL